MCRWNTTHSIFLQNLRAQLSQRQALLEDITQQLQTSQRECLDLKAENNRLVGQPLFYFAQLRFTRLFRTCLLKLSPPAHKAATASTRLFSRLEHKSDMKWKRWKKHSSLLQNSEWRYEEEEWMLVPAERSLYWMEIEMAEFHSQVRSTVVSSITTFFIILKILT